MKPMPCRLPRWPLMWALLLYAGGSLAAGQAIEPALQLRQDGLAVEPQLTLWLADSAAVRGEPARFHARSNYLAWIARAELRIVADPRHPEEAPVAVVPAVAAGESTWNVPAGSLPDTVYAVLRVYDAQGRYDETRPRAIALLAQAPAAPDLEAVAREEEQGQSANGLALANIPVRGATVLVTATGLAPGDSLEALGVRQLADEQGVATLRQILPSGTRSVEARWLSGGQLRRGWRQELELRGNDLFIVAMGDLTLGRNNVSGPAALVTGDTQHYGDSSYLDARAAFFLKQPLGERWRLTASADTREQPVDQLFSNFARKDPRYLLRSLDPNLYYPVYGDDSTTVDDAPTQGKFYLKLGDGSSHLMWGNFQSSLGGTGSELVQYARGLYGAGARWRSDASTSFGERRTQVDAFDADPGTLGARDDFRATGGSLYYLRHQDITMGSEQVWVEVRDRDSGLVLDRRRLAAVQDYEVSALQGRIMLRDGLASYAGGSGLVLDSSLGGNPQYLVVSYEYAPGLSEVGNLTTGAHASQWLNDNVSIGATTYHQGESGAEQSLRSVDATLRYRPNTWLRAESAHSSGAGTLAMASGDGGFGFNAATGAGGEAGAYRVEGAADLAELGIGKGRVSAYVQDKDHGYSSPGQVMLAGQAARQQGGRTELQLGASTRLEAKVDRQDSELLKSRNEELVLHEALGGRWQAALGLRRDERENSAAAAPLLASPVLSQDGSRSDAQLRADYHPQSANGRPGDWSTYGFVQQTLARDGEREANDRVGAGGSWRANDRLRLEAEASDGSLGVGGKLGGNYRASDRTELYLNYLIESVSPLALYRGRQDTGVLGSSMRPNDALRVYEESRSTSSAGPSGLGHAVGFDWALAEHWTAGAKLEAGRIADPLAGDTQRRAAGLTLGYRQGGFKYSGGLEWRHDQNSTTGLMQTWLVRNALGYQLTPAWRLLGKVNWSESRHTAGAFQDGAYHEYVAGAAYRPVDDGRWNLLFKATNLYDVPTAGQVAPALASGGYAQRSSVYAIDAIYALTPRLSVGGKYALRIGELRLLADGSPWFRSRADLAVLRGDWHWTPRWDSLLELRRLRAQAASDARDGMLLAIYRRIEHHLKVGAGYNFTKYSDDLTDLGYRSSGWFINLLEVY